MSGIPHSLDVTHLTQAVKAEARRLGFQWVGVTPPDPPPHLRTYDEWLAAGLYGEMTYLASESSRLRRSNPRLILPECCSLLVLGMHYSPAGFPPKPSSGPYQGRVAAYAWGQDYHDLIPERLEALVAFIQIQVDQPVPHRVYTDTGPLLERDLAQRAGLGWIGKNTCLIHPRAGSYFFLAEILLGIPLAFDTPFTEDRCGNCTRCLEACPTQCILPDRTLDARRCLSYLTIELKGSIPLDLRSSLGEWVFGCDLCQQVCPWNQRFALPAAEQAFRSAPEHPWIDLIAALELDASAFNRIFRDSPVKRARRRGFLRNAAVALGSLAAGSSDPKVVQALAQTMLAAPEPLVRGHAAWALGQVGGAQAHRVLQQAGAAEASADVLSEIHFALHQLEGLS